jgi:molybdopterin/thiamine biosynthesis adenylyltransferase
MNQITKVAVVGCGGIAVNLVPALSRLYDIVLIDGDKYEPKNVERQFPALHSTDNKAKVLAEMIKPNTLKAVGYIEGFVKDSLITNCPEWSGVDLIIGCVDNNNSRKILIGLGDELQIPVIVSGNETEEGEAHAFIPWIYNPLDHFEFPDGEPTPWACNHDKHVEKFPQTPLANIMAASAVFHILLSLRKVTKPENAIVHSRLEPLSSTFKRAKSFLEERKPEMAEA